jgi:hypothetical protein
MELINQIEKNCIRIDWKNAASDTFMSMKQSWPSLSHVLNDDDFQSLIENYNSEDPEEYLQAMGQELTSFGFLLYNVDEGADQYCLIAIPMEESAAFITEAGKAKIKIELQKQPRRKNGLKASRIKLSEQIAHEKIPLKGSYSLGWPLTFTTQAFFNNGAFSHDLSFLVNLATWPPELRETKKITRLAHHPESKTWAAIFTDPETKKSTLKLGKDPWNASSWTEADFPGELHLLSSLYWINDDLLICREKNAWLLESAATGNLKCKFLCESKDRPLSIRGAFPAVINIDANRQYILFFTQFYEWKSKQLKPTGMYAEEHSEFNSFPTGESRFVYVADGKLVEVDIENKRTRYRNLVRLDAKTRIQRFNDVWSVLLRYGAPNKTISIAQFWNPRTDRWKEIKLGAFGKHGMLDLLVADGNIFIQCHEEILIRVKDLDEVFSDPKYDVLNANPWSESWDDKTSIEPKAKGNESIPWYKKIFDK